MVEKIILESTFDCLDDVDSMFGWQRPSAVRVHFDDDIPTYIIKGVNCPLGTCLTLNKDNTVSYKTPDGRKGIINV